MPEADELPPPGLAFEQMETAKAFHCSWVDWLALPASVKGELMAHERHKHMRDGYYAERRRAALQKKAGSPEAKSPLEGIRNQFFR